MQKKDKVLVLFDAPGRTTLDRDYSEDFKAGGWETEAHVVAALKTLGYPHDLLGISDDTDLIRQKIQAYQPDIIFNLVEQFNNNSAYDQHITSFLELQGVPFTGCSSTGLMLCKNKGISKQILSYHRIRVPAFIILPRGKRIVRPRKLSFPIFIKPLKEEASSGIALASFVESDEQFQQRVAFIHEKFEQPAIAEEYIDGRELYVSIIGNQSLQAFPIREIVFTEVPPEEPKFASYKAKWDEQYRKRWGIQNRFATELDDALVQRIERTCKKIYRLLAIDGYARIDLRLTPANELVFIEANPNPILASDEDFAESARQAGVSFPQLIDKIIQLGRTASRQ